MCSRMHWPVIGILAVFLVVALFFQPVNVHAASDSIRVKPEPLPDLSKKLVPVVDESRLTFTDGKESIAINFVARDSEDREIDFREVTEFRTVSEKVEGGFKWSYSFVLPREDFKATVNVVADKSIRLLNKDFIVLDEDKFMSFEDVIVNGFTFDIVVLNEREAQITFFKDWVKAGIKVGETVLIDPYVVSYPFHDGYIEKRVTGVFDVFLTSITLSVGNNVGTGDSDYVYRAYLKFNTSMIDSWDSIVNATFYGRVASKTCSSGSSRFWLQNISNYGDLGESDWDAAYQNISIYFYANENSTGWQTVNVSNWIAKAASTFYRIQGSYENYAGVDCFIDVNSNESSYEPYIEIYYTDGSPAAPNITIHSPANATFTTEVMNLAVSPYGGAGSIDKWWYSLNGGINVTFVPNTTIYVPLGGNCINVWLNNTFGRQSMNQTCFTVSSYGTNLVCQAFPDMIPVGLSTMLECNYSYARNNSAIIDASCLVSLNDTVLIKRFLEVNSEEQFVNDSFAGFSVYLPTEISDVGGGAYLRCTNQTLGNFSIWAFISATNPFISMDGVINITSVNYTDFIGSFSCSFLDALFGVMNSTVQPINLYANQSWLQQSLVSLGNPSMAYYGFYGGCSDCSGGNDSWYVGVNAHNSGYTYHGNLSQTSNWTAFGPEHAQWIFATVGSIPLVYNVTSGWYEVPYIFSQWSEPKQYTGMGNCSNSFMENRTDYFHFNLTSASLPTCSIDSYTAIVLLEGNQTFTWSVDTLTPLLESFALLRNSTGDALFIVNSTGTFSLQMNDTGAHMLYCYARNVAGNGSDVVNFDVEIVDFQLSLFYSPYAVAGSPTMIKAYIILNGTSVFVIPNLTIFIDGSEGDMVWVPADSAYEVMWIPFANGDYSFNVSGDFPPVLVEDGLIKVRTPFNITIRIWNNINMTAGSEYRNEFAWIYFIRDVDPTLHVFFGRDKFACPPEGSDECYWHGAYRNGTATITLYEIGNYSMFIVGNNIDWYLINPLGVPVTCAFCPPVKTQSRLLLNLGSYYLNGAEDFDLYENPTELVISGFSFGIFASWLSLGAFAILAMIFFFIVLMATGSLKAAIAAMVILPTIIYLAMNVFLW